MTHRMTRRAALFGLAASSTAVSVLPALAQGPGAALRLRSVAVDATRLAALGNPAGADRLSVVLGRQMQEVFADLIVPNAAGGATLVARISSLYLGPYAGGRDYGRRNSSGAGSDSLDGVGILTSGSRVLSQTPILAVLEPGYSGAWFLPDIDDLRLASISHQFAWWLRREMGV